MTQNSLTAFAQLGGLRKIEARSLLQEVPAERTTALI